jgi:translation initiation factor IF-1
MRKKTLIALSAVSCLGLATFFAVQAATTKTVKNAIIEKIDHDAKTLEAVKNGTTYVVNAGSAKIRRGISGSHKINFSKVKKGDVINIEGSFDDDDVVATKIRDLSYYNKHTATFYGVIDSITESTKTFKIDTLDRDEQTVAVLSSTDIENEDGHSIEFSDLKEDDKVLVRGTWNDSANTITKTKWVHVLDDDDYDDLDSLLPAEK